MTIKQLILSFTDIRATDLPLVGGKGANLGELTHAGFPVPSGFCLTTIAFQEFIESCPESATLYALLDTVTADDVETARKVGQHVRQTLLDVPVPQHIIDAVKQEWQQVGQDDAYAVRSSATAEDLPDASFAGQQDTYLNVRGHLDLVDAIRRCWVSLFTDRAILYRCQNNFSHQEVLLSVVVQQMVMAEMSGILFTADPLTGHRHTVAIDASFGLGEALVSGLVSPDAYRVDKRTQTIIERQIADKQIAIFPEKEGGTRQETLSPAQRGQTVLTDAQILALAAMGSRIEAHYDAPQDIEWAIVAGQIYLLQARPITSLFPINGLQSPDDSLHIYFSMGHQQMMTNAMSPLGLSLIQSMLPLGRAENEIESTLMRSNGGRLFMDITLALRHPILRKIFMTVMSQFDALTPETAQIAMQRAEFQRPNELSVPFSMLGGLLRVLSQVASALWWQDLTGSTSYANNIIAQHLKDVKAELTAAPTGEAKVRAIIHILQSSPPVILNWVPRFVASEMANRLIHALGRNWADPADLEAYNLGLPGNVVTEMNLAVGDLADIARRAPQLSTLFKQLGNDSHAWLAQASKIEDSGEFMEAWNAFIARYGARGSSEIDIKMPRWYEEPLSLLQVIASYLEKEAGSHRTQHQKLVNAQKMAVTRLISKANHGMFGWPFDTLRTALRSRFLKRLIHVVHEGSVLREHHKFLMVQMIGLIKEVTKEIAIDLTNANKLSHPDDIWFLTWPELLAVCSGNEVDAAQIVATRRASWSHFEKMNPPLIITSDGEAPVVKYHVADAPPGALIGNPVSPGVVEGPVRVIHNPQTETLNPGEILVAPFTDPGWTPLFINAGGLIMEVGGIMTHGSVVAREYGIPAIVGVRDATNMLETGQLVRIDGNRGIIELL